MYKESVEGLASSDPGTVITSALWVATNPNELEDPSVYGKACELLLLACNEDLECVKYIDECLSDYILLKAQLFSQVLGEAGDAEIKSTTQEILNIIIDQAITIKAENTDAVAEIYSYLEQSGDAGIMEKAKALL